ncbi:uncharacterized protein EDB91DRAFT_1255001 [Suillus paluster]|uniref:uncharacterized protein n=1 Tax=Suillus paluster TaxID=48578 RepID=UPI001B860EEC|nr:uncharacterized protein EDB91DRAFT_1255001 [Suillus paluster]KAG1724947.1 hypothetical protein EDB91DRAFT_1255001 [Suillus paluster]
MSFSFAAFTPPAPLDSGKDWILAEWKELEDRVIAEAKCILDDKEELQEEWRMWCERWADIMVSDPSIPFDTEHYPSASRECYPTALTWGRAQDVVLTMSGEARAAGVGANEQYEQWMGIDSPPRTRTGSAPAQPPSTDRTGGSASLAPRINRMKMEVAILSKSAIAQKTITHDPPCARCIKVKKECKCEYASFGKATGLKGKVLDAPTLSASASGSLCRTVSSPGLAVLSGSEPEIVEAPVKCATRNTRKAAEPKGKGKGKAKEVVPATPTVGELSDEVSHYEKGEIMKVQHELRVLKGQLISLYESAYKISTEVGHLERHLGGLL